MTLLDLLFPRTCLGCGEIGRYFCPLCIQKIKLIDSQICPVCEKSSPYGETHRFCQKKYSLDGLISLFVYEGMIRKAIHQLKFKFVTDLNEEFFGLVRERWKMRENDRFSQMKRFIKDKKPIIIPVPLFWYKENQRGFNQSEIFAQKLAQFWNLEFKKDFLIRAKFTQSQVGLSEEERQKNIANAFSFSSNIQYQISNIILIDDIWTTGATLKACAGLLKKSGARTVWGLTMAR